MTRDDDSYCQIDPSLFLNNEVFQRYVFKSTFAINFTHRAAPRFGNRADIETLALGSKADQQEYLKGLVSGAICIFVVFLVWTLLLVFFKFRGPEKYGWLSGSRIPLPPNPLLDENNNDLALVDEDENDEGDEEVDAETTRESHPTERQEETELSGADSNLLNNFDKWNAEYTRRQRQNWRMKCLVLAAAVGIIIFDIIMVSLGVPGLTSFVDSARESLAIALELVEKALVTVDLLVTFIDDAVLHLVGFLEDLNEICDNVTLCADVFQPPTCFVADNALGEDFIINPIILHFSGNKNVILNQVEEARGLLLNIQRKAQNTDDTLRNVDWLFHLSSFFAILLVFLCVVVIVSLLLELPNRVRRWSYRCNYFFPFFVFLVIFAFTFAIAFVISATGLADFCYESPNERVVLILQELRQTLPNIADEILGYLLNGCQFAPPSAVQNYLIMGSNFLKEFGFRISNSSALEQFQDTCGVINATKWADAAFMLGDRLCKASSTVADLRSFFECQTWYPLYRSTVYYTICYNVDAFSWIAFTQLVVICMAMIIVTCRVTLYHGIEIEYTDLCNNSSQAEPGQTVQTEDGAMVLGDGRAKPVKSCLLLTGEMGPVDVDSTELSKDEQVPPSDDKEVLQEEQAPSDNGRTQ